MSPGTVGSAASPITRLAGTNESGSLMPTRITHCMIAAATYVSSRLEMTMLVLKRLPSTAEMPLQSPPATRGDDDARRDEEPAGQVARCPPAVANATAAMAPSTNWPSAPIVNSRAR